MFRKQRFKQMEYNNYLEKISSKINFNMVSGKEPSFEDLKYIKSLDYDMKIWALNDYFYYVKNEKVYCDGEVIEFMEMESLSKSDIAKYTHIAKRFGLKMLNWLIEDSRLILSFKNL